MIKQRIKVDPAQRRYSGLSLVESPPTDYRVDAVPLDGARRYINRRHPSSSPPRHLLRESPFAPLSNDLRSSIFETYIIHRLRIPLNIIRGDHHHRASSGNLS